MKILDYSGFALLIIGMVAGWYIGGFAGGGLWGICLCSFCFAIVGAILKKKADTRIKNARAERLMDAIDNKIIETDGNSENN